jgi:uncharacterized protein YjbJ (UPF0337 family)
MVNNGFEYHWGEIRRQATQWWRMLSDDDLKHVHGERSQLANALQRRYGYSREMVESEIDRRMKEYEKEKRKNEEETHAASIQSSACP